MVQTSKRDGTERSVGQGRDQDPGQDDGRIVVRNLRPEDLDAVVKLDARNVGRSRREYFRLKLAENLVDTGIKVSLAAELDGRFVGYLLARVYYGEFGAVEPAAVLDSLGVYPDAHREGVGHALVAQLRQNLIGLAVTRLRTEVSFDTPSLLSFFQREGFRPSGRICLELPVT